MIVKMLTTVGGAVAVLIVGAPIRPAQEVEFVFPEFLALRCYYHFDRRDGRV
jgi:hypothetical protein